MKTTDSSPCLRSIVMFPCYEDAMRMRLGDCVCVCVSVSVCVLGGKEGLS